MRILARICPGGEEAGVFGCANDYKLPSAPDPSAGLPLVEIMQLVFGVIGVIAVVMIMVGGLKYIMSQGNPQETAKAKNTILYAIIGLVLAASSFSIVSFLVGRVDPTSQPTTSEQDDPGLPPGQGQPNTPPSGAN